MEKRINWIGNFYKVFLTYLFPFGFHRVFCSGILKKLKISTMIKIGYMNSDYINPSYFSVSFLFQLLRLLLDEYFLFKYYDEFLISNF